MFFRRDTKTPLEYALNFIHLAEETARSYWHDRDYIPTKEVMRQLCDLHKAAGDLHYFLGLLAHRLHKRTKGGSHE